MPLNINPKSFRGFSIRGVVGEDFDTTSMKNIGYAVGVWFKNRSAKQLVVGHDVRVTSPELHNAVCMGILSASVDVIDIGLTPTPILNFATDYFKADGGVMVTASHNPSEYNGLKIRGERTVFGQDLQDIFTLAIAEQHQLSLGRITKVSPMEAYSEALSKRISSQRPLKIVVDGGNGANGKIVPNLLRSFGHEVYELFCEPDGTFPNRDPDPTVPHATDRLSGLVLNKKADLGLAFDGDGDRVILVDEKGERVLGDETLMILADNTLVFDHTSKVAYEVLCSHAVPDYISMAGGTPIPAPSGYAFVHDKMLSTGAKVGGEMSGHFFLLDDDFKFDDAILAACKITSILSASPKSLSEIVSTLPKYYASDEYRIDCGKEFGDVYKKEIVDAVRLHYINAGYSLEEIDGVSIDFGNAWALVRQSNTQPVISLRFESKNSISHMQEISRVVLSKVAQEFQKKDLSWPYDIYQ